MVLSVESKRLPCSSLVHAIPLDYKKPSQRLRILVKVTGLNQIRLTTLKSIQDWSPNLNKSLPITFPDLVRSGNPIQWVNADKQRRVFHHKC